MDKLKEIERQLGALRDSTAARENEDIYLNVELVDVKGKTFIKLTASPDSLIQVVHLLVQLAVDPEKGSALYIDEHNASEPGSVPIYVSIA